MENIDVSFGPLSKKSKETRTLKRYCPGCNKGVEAKLITNPNSAWELGTYVFVKHNNPQGGRCPYSNMAVSH